MQGNNKMLMNTVTILVIIAFLKEKLTANLETKLYPERIMSEFIG